MPEAESSGIEIDETSASIQTHLQITQGVVERMAASSSSCKTWCITIVAAILVVVADKGKPELAWVAILPIVLFAALDAYYLAMEKGFRHSYASFLRKLHAKALTADDLYSVEPSRDHSKFQLSAFRSFSIWGFYVPLILLAGFVVIVVST